MSTSQSFRMKLFCLNNTLHFSNNKKIYKLHENNAVFVKESDYCGMSFLSYCDITVCINHQDKMTKVNNDYSEEDLCKFENNIGSFAFG